MITIITYNHCFKDGPANGNLTVNCQGEMSNALNIVLKHGNYTLESSDIVCPKDFKARGNTKLCDSYGLPTYTPTSYQSLVFYKNTKIKILASHNFCSAVNPTYSPSSEPTTSPS